MNDIEVLKQHCVETHNKGEICFTYNDAERIRNLINRIKDLEEINEAHKKENGELRERVNKQALLKEKIIALLKGE